MKKVTFNIYYATKGYVKTFMRVREGEDSVQDVEFTDNVHEAYLFHEEELNEYAPLFEKELGVLRGQGLGTPKYLPKKFIISTPHGYVYDLATNGFSTELKDISYTKDLDDAKQIFEDMIEAYANAVSGFIDVPINAGMAYIEVKTVYA